MNKSVCSLEHSHYVQVILRLAEVCVMYIADFWEPLVAEPELLVVAPLHHSRLMHLLMLLKAAASFHLFLIGKNVVTALI